MWDPVRNVQVAGSALNADKTEEDVISQLENWFLSHESGIAVGISPRKEPTENHPGYPEEQITFYRIGYELVDIKTFKTKKILFVTSHQFKAQFKNPEALRRFIFPEDDKEESIFKILDWLKKISQKDVETRLHNIEERKTQARYYARQIVSGVPIDKVAYDMQQTRFLGNNPIGCGGVSVTPDLSGPSLFTISPFFSYSEVESWHSGTCRVCGSSTWVGPCSICKPCESKF